VVTQPASDIVPDRTLHKHTDEDYSPEAYELDDEIEVPGTCIFHVTSIIISPPRVSMEFNQTWKDYSIHPIPTM